MGTYGIKAERRGRVLVLTLDLVPSNALLPAVRAGILAQLKLLAGCDAVVLTGMGPSFSSALSLDPDKARPSLTELCQAIAEAPVPVVAALHGLVMGPGAELALAARARIASPDTRIAFPEIALGLCPGGGASLRLPARIGAEAALQLLLSGRAVVADEALALGLVDQITDAPLLDAGLAFAKALGPPLTPRLEHPARHLAAVAAARRADPLARAAARGVIACVEAACLFPAAAALAHEAVTRADLEAGADATGLRAAARAEGLAARLPPAVARTDARPLTELALVGSDPALADLARAALAQGVSVLWLYPGKNAVAAGLGQSLRLTDDPAALDGAVVQIHAAPPAAHMSRPLGPGAALLVLGGSEADMGLSVTPGSRVCELAMRAEDSSQAVATAVAGLRRIGMAPVLVGQRPLLGARVARAGRAALHRLALQGVPADRLQGALQAFAADEVLHGASLAATPAADAAEKPAEPPLWSTQAIQRRWLAGQANEALRLLGAGMALRPSDIDHLLVSVHGFPRWRGGPMHQADRRGLLVLRHDLRDWAAQDAFWTPAPLLDRLVGEGLRLADLDQRL